MEAGEQERQLAYWQQQLGGEQPVLELPTDHPRPVSRSFAGASCNLTLDPGLSEGLKSLARRESVSLFSVLLASFQALLHRYSGQADIRVGVPVANRERPEIERLIGFFVNTQVLRAEVDGQQTFEQLLRQPIVPGDVQSPGAEPGQISQRLGRPAHRTVAMAEPDRPVRPGAGHQ